MTQCAPTHAFQTLLRQCASPRAMVSAGFGFAFAAALLLWLHYGPSVFIDGLAMAWSCF